MNSVLTEQSGSETAWISATHTRIDAADPSFVRHHKYYFKDGNVTFLVDGTLYCVHRYFFSRDSVYFSTRFSKLGIHDHEALPITISLGNIERKDFDAFLSILYPEDFKQRNLSYEEWKSVLHLSTQWEFASIRRLALNNIQPPTPHDQLLLARTYSVGRWVIPALSALCERREPLSVDEARQMNIEDIVLVATVREDIRNSTLQVDTAEIPGRVEAAQAGKLARVDTVDSPSAVPTGGAIEQAPSPVVEKQDSNEYDTKEVDGEALEMPGTLEDIPVRIESAQLVDDSGGEVVVTCEAGAEDVRNTRGETMKTPEEEEVARRQAYVEVMKRAKQEETARRRDYEQEAMRARQENKARLQALGTGGGSSPPPMKTSQESGLNFKTI